jgi:hypothetical protein
VAQLHQMRRHGTFDRIQPGFGPAQGVSDTAVVLAPGLGAGQCEPERAEIQT